MKRITTALIGFPLVAIVLVLGNKYVIDVFFAIAAIFALYEYNNALKIKAKPIQWIGYLACSGGNHSDEEIYDERYRGSYYCVVERSILCDHRDRIVESDDQYENPGYGAEDLSHSAVDHICGGAGHSLKLFEGDGVQHALCLLGRHAVILRSGMIL